MLLLFTHWVVFPREWNDTLFLIIRFYNNVSHHRQTLFPDNLASELCPQAISTAAMKVAFPWGANDNSGASNTLKPFTETPG